MNEPKVPPVSEHPSGKYDSNFVYEYYKEHYWDGISFSDDRLVRTPFSKRGWKSTSGILFRLTRIL